jgi:hypothetical protein
MVRVLVHASVLAAVGAGGAIGHRVSPALTRSRALHLHISYTCLWAISVLPFPQHRILIDRSQLYVKKTHTLRQ